VTNSPVGIGHAVRFGIVRLVGQPKLFSAVKVVENLERSRVQFVGGLRHSSTEHANCIANVRSCVSGAIQEGADNTLILFDEVGVDVVLARQSIRYPLG
jgi:hypothetical protein